MDLGAVKGVVGLADLFESQGGMFEIGMAGDQGELTGTMDRDWHIVQDVVRYVAEDTTARLRQGLWGQNGEWVVGEVVDWHMGRKCSMGSGAHTAVPVSAHG